MNRFYFSRSCVLASCVVAGGTLAAAPYCRGIVVANPTSLYAFSVNNNTGSTQSSLGMSLAGDQTGSLPADNSTEYLNSFGTSSSASYNSSTTDTTVTYSGGTVNSGSTATVGFTWTSFAGPQIDSAAWGSGSAIDPVSMTDQVFSAAASADPYAIAFVDVTPVTTPPSATEPVGQWFEFSYYTSQPRLIFTNYTSASEQLSNAGYMLSSTQIPLDQLNTLPSSDFTALPLTYDKTLAPGASESYAIVPEPAALALLGFGGAALLLIRRRRRYA
ncbi:MAG: PEP-CTERM sorting domain-containing protein [Phycisphaerae bacterium]